MHVLFLTMLASRLQTGFKLGWKPWQEFSAIKYAGWDEIAHNKMDDYIQNFLCNPHAKLGRRGSVCPFVRFSLDERSLYFTVIEKDIKDIKEVLQLCFSAADDFNKLPGENLGKALVILFPKLTDPVAAKEVIERVHAKSKEHFIARGLLIGEFHQNNNTPAFHNPEFHPLQTSIPCLVIRALIPADIKFMNQAKDDVQKRIKFLKAFVSQFTEIVEVQRAQKELSALQGTMNKSFVSQDWLKLVIGVFIGILLCGVAMSKLMPL